MENLPFPDEIILNILSCLSIFDLSKCAQVCKGLNKICEDKEFQQYRELKKLFKNSNLKLTRNDSIMVNITDEEATKNINKALELNGNKIELILKRTLIRKKDPCLIIQEDYFSKLLDNRYPSGAFTNYVYKFCQFLTTYLPLFTLVNFWTTTYLPVNVYM